MREELEEERTKSLALEVKLAQEKANLEQIFAKEKEQNGKHF